MADVWLFFQLLLHNSPSVFQSTTLTVRWCLWAWRTSTPSARVSSLCVFSAHRCPIRPSESAPPPPAPLSHFTWLCARQPDLHVPPALLSEGTSDFWPWHSMGPEDLRTQDSLLYLLRDSTAGFKITSASLTENTCIHQECLLLLILIIVQQLLC